jgi:hypothetical protein
MAPSKILAALVAALVSFAALAADDMVIRSQRAQVAQFAGAPIEAVRNRPLRNSESWEFLGDYSLLVYETRGKAYLVDLEKEERCRDLSTEYLMHLDSRLNWLDTRTGTIELRPGHGWCRIVGIRPVDVAAMKADRKLQRGT